MIQANSYRQALIECKELKPDSKNPLLSIIIPTHFSVQKISYTLKSILEQSFQDFEILIIDAESEDRTLECIQQYQSNKIHIYSHAQEYKIFKMFNRALPNAKGLYINMLLPGDTLISSHALARAFEELDNNQYPDLLYGAYLKAKSRSHTQHTFDADNLRLSKNPSKLQQCFIKRKQLKAIHNFSHNFQVRGDLDLFCKVWTKGNWRVSSVSRVFVDIYTYQFTINSIYINTLETLSIIGHYFSKYDALKWLFSLKGQSFLKLWLKKTFLMGWSLKDSDPQ